MKAELESIENFVGGRGCILLYICKILKELLNKYIFGDFFNLLRWLVPPGTRGGLRVNGYNYIEYTYSIFCCRLMRRSCSVCTRAGRRAGQPSPPSPPSPPPPPTSPFPPRPITTPSSTAPPYRAPAGGVARHTDSTTATTKQSINRLINQ